jgi:hypothetical protein
MVPCEKGAQEGEIYIKIDNVQMATELKNPQLL